MYSQRHECRADYTLTPPGGQHIHIKPGDYLHVPARIGGLYFKDTLPELNQYLCEGFRRHGALGSLNATVECRDTDGPWQPRVSPNVDICRADNFGVVR